MEITNTRVTGTPAPARETQRLYLMAVAGSHVGAVHKVEGARTVLGRGEGAQIRVTDDGVSREHAELVVENGRVLVRDLASTNGTYVNGARAATREVRAGDQISVGTATFVVFMHGDGLDDELPRGRVAGGSLDDVVGASVPREGFVARIAEEISFARRHGESLALLVCELADAVALEALVGTRTYRALLAEVRAACLAAVPASDLVASLGGGRFAALARRTTSAEAVQLARQLRDAVALASGGTSVELRLGIATPTASAKPAVSAAAALAAAESSLVKAHERRAAVVEAT
ncbi:MAG TPA: FHA domain-containing protein [Polyangia bacterium]|nr:FHA domain-containing protein [Polyangia bacterium]